MSEYRIQQEIVMWFNNTYPSLRGLLCYNNNNSNDGLTGKRNKFLGIVKGRSDMVLYYHGNAYMIELKDDIGRQKPEQVEWQKKVENQGFEYVIIRSLEEFKNYMEMLIGE